MTGTSLPKVSSTIPAGLPSDLLFSRPDIVAAEGRMEAARLRAGVAKAARRPTFVLTAAGGTQSDALRDLSDSGQRFSSLAGSLTAPVFNAGALKASSQAAMEQYRAAVASYDQVVLTAVNEVESALVSFGSEQQRVESLEAAVAQAEASYTSQLERFGQGAGDFMALLDAELNLLQAQSSLASGRRSLTLARLSVHRALGGAWVAPVESQS
jgi:multidrug efflux system outer membrane protein